MRTQILKSQFESDGLHLIGVQEARNPQGARLSGPFLILSSGAVQGGLGCEL